MLDDLLGWLAGSVLEAVIESPVQLLELVGARDGSEPLEPTDKQPGNVLRLR